jgi:transcriptional regulator with XRE-family HTH domain
LSELRKKFGIRIRQLREEMGKTQEQFAEIAGMSVDFLSLIERGRNAPSFKKLERMSLGLKTPVASFFTFDLIEAPAISRRRSRTLRAHKSRRR